MEKKYNKVVLAYSGGLDTSVLIPWLKEHYGCEVIAVSGNVGQGTELDGLEEKALKTGASKLYIEDLTKDFVDDYIIPASVTSPYSLYSEDMATFNEDDCYDQADSAGFINLFGLPLKVRALNDQILYKKTGEHFPSVEK